MRVKLDLGKDTPYIHLTVESPVGSMVLRSWPWPHNAAGRTKHLKDAVLYGNRLAVLLACRFDIGNEFRQVRTKLAA